MHHENDWEKSQIETRISVYNPTVIGVVTITVIIIVTAHASGYINQFPCACTHLHSFLVV